MLKFSDIPLSMIIASTWLNVLDKQTIFMKGTDNRHQTTGDKK